MSKGLYGGFSVDGSVAGVRSSLNKAYYGKEVTPTDILIKGDVKNAQANRPDRGRRQAGRRPVAVFMSERGTVDHLVKPVLGAISMGLDRGGERLTCGARRR